MFNLSLFPELENPSTTYEILQRDLSQPKPDISLAKKLITGEINISFLNVVVRTGGLSVFTYLDEDAIFTRPKITYYIAYIPDVELLSNELGIPYCFSTPEKALQFLIEQYSEFAPLSEERSDRAERVQTGAKKLYVPVTRKVSPLDRKIQG